jgi:signal peptidase I
MLPLLRDGDVVTVTPAARTEIRVGDVICYEALPGRLVVHRVIGHARDRFLAKGDALSAPDSVDPPQLLGKITAIERFGTARRLDTRAARLCNRLMAALSRRTPLVPLAIDAARRVRAATRG